MSPDAEAAPELRCAVCDAPLPAGVQVCERCSPPAEVTLQQTKPIDALLNRARRQLAFGGWLFLIYFAPLALRTAHQAQMELAHLGVRDAALEGRIRRVQLMALAATILAYGVVALMIWGFLQWRE